MNKSIKLLVASVIAVAALMPTKADAQKFGHINSQEIVALMPERDEAYTKLQAFGKELNETISSMQTDYQTKLKEYNEKVSTWNESIKKTKEDELNSLMQRIRQFSEQAEQDFNSRQETLLTPVMKKAQDAIDKVAKAQGLAYVFDLASGAIIYIDEANTVNLLPLVKAELGIPASKTQPTQFNN
ncbi:MAG: OmpH family outer membrane protein [Bacteroidales bacterium]|nr:OmpH family outer membrane protein [Bacteroidales bacterium]